MDPKISSYFPNNSSQQLIDPNNESGLSINSSFQIPSYANESYGTIVVMSDELPKYIRITAFICISVILAVGTIGNTMVTLVISCSRDMRTSTNFFLINLSLADLLVLVLVTPTALLEVVYNPEIWLLGSTMCKLVPVLEMTVCHASVLTILAISFERYYAICSPLKANYVCTKARAVWICIFVWILAIIITSPLFFMTQFYEIQNDFGVKEPKCIVGAGSFWPDLYTAAAIALFFFLPFIILVITYGVIAKRLTEDRSALNAKNENSRGRKQVVLMLGTVVFTFFLCLLPFRLLTLVHMFTDYGDFLSKHTEAYYTTLYTSRILSYVNSALNPILYNIMSSKFRNGFLRLCGRRRKQFIFHRNGTFLTLTTTNNNHNGINQHFNLVQTYSTSPSTSPELIPTGGSSTTGLLLRKNGLKKSGSKNGQGRKSYSFHERRKSCTGTHFAKSGKIEMGKKERRAAGSSSLRKDFPLLSPKALNPKSLSKKFIYSYVSGHSGANIREESML